MASEVIGITLVGFGVGLIFRVNVLLPILALLLLLSIGDSIAHHVGFFKSALTVIGVQVITQASYFLGVIVRSLMRYVGKWVLI